LQMEKEEFSYEVHAHLLWLRDLKLELSRLGLFRTFL